MFLTSNFPLLFQLRILYRFLSKLFVQYFFVLISPLIRLLALISELIFILHFLIILNPVTFCLNSHVVLFAHKNENRFFLFHPFSLISQLFNYLKTQLILIIFTFFSFFSAQVLNFTNNSKIKELETIYLTSSHSHITHYFYFFKNFNYFY